METEPGVRAPTAGAWTPRCESLILIGTARKRVIETARRNHETKFAHVVRVRIVMFMYKVKEGVSTKDENRCLANRQAGM